MSDGSLTVMPAPGRYGVLLNARAKGWTGEVHEAVQRFVPRQDLYLTEDFRQARQAVQRVLAADYDVIFTGGGDGTVVYLINAVEQAIQAGELKRDEAPPVGVLRLGTGNAVASYVGAGPIIDDLRLLHAGAPLQVRSVNMVEDGEHRFPFAGFGWDADILNDYDRFKAAVRDTAMEGFATGLGGYAFSIGTRTIPRAVLRGARVAKFTNLGDVAYKLDEYGQIVAEYGPGEVLFRGPIKIASPASIPNWGFNIRMFPYANLRPGFFELRCYSGSISRILMDLPGFWRGAIAPALLGDWLVQKVQVDIQDGAMSYQVAGDAAGYRDQVVWSLAEHGARLAVPLR